LTGRNVELYPLWLYFHYLKTEVGQRKQTMIAQPAEYSAFEMLRAGQRVEIRALRAQDRDDFIAAAGRLSAESLYRRFFSAKQGFSEKERSFFVDVDFANHVALIAVLDEGGTPVVVGGGRYVIVKPGLAEVAFAVVDEYQGQGLGAALVRHLVAIARNAGLSELTAEVLPHNAAMLKAFEKSGLTVRTKRESGTVHVTLQLT
jgi:RimJ/RimL family protein N-acetyltransferase